eukprot:TRINITY_DN5456_c0_g1_i5.p1 TRINITY_DN5456_c0_g1~~TRINITY_DN5456_c0_g1_i5.p1  ORF type:complete len:1119 (+),score=346.40 TRINITY_DN5456_c0_g1_i5:77-3433(+)
MLKRQLSGELLALHEGQFHKHEKEDLEVPADVAAALEIAAALDGEDEAAVLEKEKFEAPKVEFTMEQEIPFDTRVVTGELENGMKYFVMQNQEPQNRVELNVAIKSGSIHEADNERGVAHMVEHLGFRSSEGMEGEFEIIKQLEALGIKFGPHQNAYTSFDRTVYQLQVPLDDMDMLKQGMRALYQLSLQMRLSDEDVDRERSVVVEEWRQSLSADTRSCECLCQSIYKGSIVPDRMPIGVMDVIENVSPDTVRGFYRRSYHPELTAVVAVGAFTCELAEVVGMIQEIFGALPRREDPPPPRPLVEVPIQPEPVVSIFSDKELSDTTVSVCVRQPQVVQPTTVADYRKLMVLHLFHTALSERLSKIAQRNTPPFIAASSCLEAPLTGMHVFTLSVSCQEGREAQGLSAVLTEIEHIKRTGLKEREVANAKRNAAKWWQHYLLSHAKRESAAACAELVDHFLSAATVVPPDWETGMALEVLEGIEPYEVSAAVAAYHWGKGTVVHINRPAALKGGLRQGAERVAAAVKRMLSRADAAPLDSLQGVAAGGLGNQIADIVNGGPITEEGVAALLAAHRDDDPETAPVRALLRQWSSGALSAGAPSDFADLLPIDLEAGSIVKRAHYAGPEDGLDCHELVLSNGMEVVYKQTDFQDDEILFSINANGGMNEVPPEHMMDAIMADAIAQQMGIFGVPPRSLLDLLAGRRITFETSVGNIYRGCSGVCPADDLETALQMIHVLFTARIEYDEERVEHVMALVREGVASQSRDPSTQFSNTLWGIITQNHPWYAPASVGMLDRVDAKHSLSIFNDMFKNPAEFRMVLCGSLDPSEAEQLFEIYLASIPVPDPAPGPILSVSEVTPLKITFPNVGEVCELHLPMVDDTASTVITLPAMVGGAANPTHQGRMQDEVLLAFACRVAQDRLTEVLRFDLGSVYSVSVSHSEHGRAPPRLPEDPVQYVVSISYTCKPSEVPVLRQKILEELAKMQHDPPPDADAADEAVLKEEEVSSAITAAARDTEVDQRTNEYWIGKMLELYDSPLYSDDIAATLEEQWAVRSAVVEELSADSLRSAYTRFFGDLSRAVCVSMVPRTLWRNVGRWLAIAAVVSSVAFAVSRSSRNAMR